MKKNVSLAFWLLSLCLFASCDYFGDFIFEVNNHTNDTIKVSYSKQLPAYSEVYNYNNPYSTHHKLLYTCACRIGIKQFPDKR